jgi:hypothetical protein
MPGGIEPGPRVSQAPAICQKNLLIMIQPVLVVLLWLVLDRLAQAARRRN